MVCYDILLSVANYFMKRRKIKDVRGAEIFSSNDYEDDDCAVCRLMRRCELEDRDPTMKELERVMEKSKF